MAMHEQSPRERPRWAQTVHHLGDDISWALAGWCDFPRPIRRLTTALVSAGAAWLLDADDALRAVADVLVD